MFRSLFIFLLVSIAAWTEQKTVLITGATGGIGLATVKAFEERGWKVWAGYRKEIPPGYTNVEWIHLDVTDETLVEKAIATLIAKEGKIDALVNNAGFNIMGAEECLTIDEVKQLFEVNFFGAFRMIQATVPHMRKKISGHIINISSASGFRAIPGMGPYASSKFALEGLSESLAVTLSPWNIQVSLIEPGMVDNEMLYHNRWGSREADEPLYEGFVEALFNKMAGLASQGQPCAEIASLIVDVAENPNPNLRYQTSSKVEMTARKKLVDLTGNQMREEQKTFFQSLLQDATQLK